MHFIWFHTKFLRNNIHFLVQYSRVHIVTLNLKEIESWDSSFQALFRIHMMKNIGFNLEILAQWPQGLPDEMTQSENKLTHKIRPSRPNIELKLQFQIFPCSRDVHTRVLLDHTWFSWDSNLENIWEKNLRF